MISVPASNTQCLLMYAHIPPLYNITDLGSIMQPVQPDTLSLKEADMLSSSVLSLASVSTVPKNLSYSGLF